MKTEKLGQEPAYPVEVNLHNVEEQFSQNGPCTIMCHGMSKRFYAACAAMQGLLSNGRYDQRYYEGDSTSLICKRAYAIADELLKQESE